MEKYDGLTGDIMDSTRVDKAKELVLSIEGCKDVAELIRLLGAPTKNSTE